MLKLLEKKIMKVIKRYMLNSKVNVYTSLHNNAHTVSLQKISWICKDH